VVIYVCMCVVHDVVCSVGHVKWQFSCRYILTELCHVSENGFG